jgi:hypothetical protein
VGPMNPKWWFDSIRADLVQNYSLGQMLLFLILLLCCLALSNACSEAIVSETAGD